MSNRRYGFFTQQPMLDDAPQGTLSLVPEEINYTNRALKGPRSFTTSAMHRGTGIDIGLSNYQPASKNEPYESKNTFANHDFRPGKNPNRRPFLPSSNPQVSTGAASLYTTITWPDPHQDRPDRDRYTHECNETCTPDYYHAKLVNKPDDRIKGHHPNLKTRAEGDMNKGPHLQYCPKCCLSGVGADDGMREQSKRSLSAKSDPRKYGHPRAFRTRALANYDNPYKWEPDPYNDNVNHPNYRSHTYKGGSFKSGKAKNDVFDPKVYSRDIKRERKGSPEDYKGPRQFPNTMDLPNGTNVYLTAREARDGLKDKFIPGGCVHYSHPKYVSAGPYEVQEYEAKNTLHNVKDGIFLTTNPRERPKACARPRFQDFRH